MTTVTQLESVSLYFTSGNSDKEYHARIEEASGGYVVNFSYGRRGSSLTAGTKTKTPVDHAAALKVFNKLVAEKQAKGYTQGESGTPYLNCEATGKVASGLLPHLLNTISQAEAMLLIDDPAWVMQEKFDGRRLMVRKTGDTVEGINKLGLIVALSSVIAEAALALPGDFILDGEAIGDHFHVFDLISCNGADLRPKACGDRYAALVGLIDGGDAAAITYVASWSDSIDKRAQLAALRDKRAEGVVFKNVNAAYTAGRPNSGGTQRKFKFVESVSAKVTTINQQRSIGVSLLDGDDWTSVGNVTIPANHEVPQLDDVVEVRYLYAAQGGSLYQPVYLGVRSDVEAAECVLSQLKYKSG